MGRSKAELLAEIAERLSKVQTDLTTSASTIAKQAIKLIDIREALQCIDQKDMTTAEHQIWQIVEQEDRTVSEKCAENSEKIVS